MPDLSEVDAKGIVHFATVASRRMKRLGRDFGEIQLTTDIGLASYRVHMGLGLVMLYMLYSGCSRPLPDP